MRALDGNTRPGPGGSIPIAARDEGASAVEFALVLTVLVMLIVGTIQFGLVFNQWVMAEHAAREGVRWASLRNSAAFVRQRTIEAAPGLAIAPGDITVEPADPTSAWPNTPARVTVRCKVPVFTPLMETFLGAEVGLTASATQRIE